MGFSSNEIEAHLISLGQPLGVSSEAGILNPYHSESQFEVEPGSPHVKFGFVEEIEMDMELFMSKVELGWEVTGRHVEPLSPHEARSWGSNFQRGRPRRIPTVERLDLVVAAHAKAEALEAEAKAARAIDLVRNPLCGRCKEPLLRAPLWALRDFSSGAFNEVEVLVLASRFEGEAALDGVVVVEFRPLAVPGGEAGHSANNLFSSPSTSTSDDGEEGETSQFAGPSVTKGMNWFLRTAKHHCGQPSVTDAQHSHVSNPGSSTGGSSTTSICSSSSSSSSNSSNSRRLSSSTSSGRDGNGSSRDQRSGSDGSSGGSSGVRGILRNSLVVSEQVQDGESPCSSFDLSANGVALTVDANNAPGSTGSGKDCISSGSTYRDNATSDGTGPLNEVDRPDAHDVPCKGGGGGESPRFSLPIVVGAADVAATPPGAVLGV